MGLQPLEGDEVQSPGVSAFEHHRRRTARVVGLAPAQGADAPSVTRFEAGKAVRRTRGDQVVASFELVVQEGCCHARADDVAANVTLVGVAAPVAVPAGKRVVGAGHQLGAQDVEGLHVNVIVGQAFAPFMRVIAEPIRADTSVMLPGTIIVLFARASAP